MKIFLRLLFIIACPLFFSACQQTLYFPDRANTPGLSKALEAKATISIKPQVNDRDTAQHASGNVGTSVDLAFSPINHFGLIGSYRWINNRIIKEQQDVSLFSNRKNMGGVFNGKRCEIGAGYYTAIDARGIMEFYAGYGTGSLNRKGVVMPDYNYDTRYHRFFLQPAMGFRFRDFFCFTGGIKVAFVKFYDFNSQDPDFRYQVGNYQEDITKPTFVFVEPFLNFEGGYQFFKGNLQWGFSRQINQTNISGNLPMYISLGMTFMFSPDFLQKAKHYNVIE